MGTRKQHGCMWDLPPEVVSAEVRSDNKNYKANDHRLIQMQRKDADVKAAETLQACLDLPSDSEADEDNGCLHDGNELSKTLTFASEEIDGQESSELLVDGLQVLGEEFQKHR